MSTVVETDFPFVTVPTHLLGALGEAEEGTRMHHREGSAAKFDEWFAAVCEVCGPDNAVSPGGVAMFASVSRAGVHKRLKEGRLTAFLFHELKPKRVGIRRRLELVAEGLPYTLIPVAECKAWAEVIRALPSRRARKLEAIGDGDLDSDFLKLQRKGRGSARKGTHGNDCR